VFSLVQEAHGFDFVEAKKWLAQRAGIPLSAEWQRLSGEEFVALEEERRAEETRLEKLERVVAKAAGQLTPEHRAYLRRRGLTDETIAALKLGTWRDRHGACVLLPVLRHGRPVEVIGHFPGAKKDDFPPKYLFTKDRDRPTPGLELAQPRQETIVVEGFFDWAALVQAGFDAVALLGSGAADSVVERLRRPKRVYLMLDGDGAGREAAETLARELYPKAAIVELPDGKDPNDLLAYLGAVAFEETIRELLASARDPLELAWERATTPDDVKERVVPLLARLDDLELDMALNNAPLRDRGIRKETLRSEIEAARPRSSDGNAEPAEPTPSSREELWERAKRILTSDIPLELFRESLTHGGYAGETIPAEIINVAIHSRVFDRPINVGVFGPSSGGKSFTVQVVMAYHPRHAVHELTASSERALIYSDFKTEHAFVYIGEASAVAKEGVGASIIRELAWGNGLRYETVEKDEMTGKLGPRLIEQPGPTGLITTSTTALEPELSTRMMKVTITDDPDQTARIVRGVVEDLKGVHKAVPDYDEFVAASEYLERYGDREVVVPFADPLNAVPSEEVRVRRDIHQIASFLRVMAYIHQENRERDAESRIIATVDDYAETYRLLEPILGQTLTAATPAIRETVTAVEGVLKDKVGSTCTKIEVATALSRAPSTAGKRINDAIEAGFLVNNAGQGQPAEIALGDPLPMERSVLPTQEDVADWWAEHGDSSTSSSTTPGESAESPKRTANQLIDNDLTFRQGTETETQAQDGGDSGSTGFGTVSIGNRNANIMKGNDIDSRFGVSTESWGVEEREVSPNAANGIGQGTLDLQRMPPAEDSEDAERI
jgi:hypothetical protein